MGYSRTLIIAALVCSTAAAGPEPVTFHHVCFPLVSLPVILAEARPAKSYAKAQMADFDSIQRERRLERRITCAPERLKLFLRE
jgi:hypothetical protein